MTVRLAVLLLIGGLFLVFVVQNVEVVEVRFLFWSFAMSRAVLLILTLLSGLAAGWLLHGRRRSGGAKKP